MAKVKTSACTHRWLIPSDGPIVTGTCMHCNAVKEFDNRPKTVDARGVPIEWSLPYSVRRQMNARDAE